MAAQQKQQQDAELQLRKEAQEEQIRQFDIQSARENKRADLLNRLTTIESENILRSQAESGVTPTGFEPVEERPFEIAPDLEGVIQRLTNPATGESFEARTPSSILRQQVEVARQENELEFDFFRREQQEVQGLRKEINDIEFQRDIAKTQIELQNDLEMLVVNPSEEALAIMASDPENPRRQIYADALEKIGSGALTANAALNQSYGYSMGHGVMIGLLSPLSVNTRSVQGAAALQFMIENGYNFAHALNDAKAVATWVTSLNSASQMELRQALTTLNGQTPVLRRLFNDWMRLNDGTSDWQIINQLKQGAAVRFDGQEKAAAAQALISQVDSMVAALASVYRVGDSPTADALAIAEQDLKSTWSEAVMNKSINLLEEDLQIRVNSLMSIGPAGLFDPNSIYLPEPNIQILNESQQQGDEFADVLGGLQ
jgi:hypothetical protein